MNGFQRVVALVVCAAVMSLAYYGVSQFFRGVRDTIHEKGPATKIEQALDVARATGRI